MEYQPNWKSKILTLLFGQKRLMTLLDTGQLMFREDFKQNPQFKSISNQIIYSGVAANITVIAVSLLLARTVFFKTHFFNPVKMLADCSIVFISYYAAAFYLSQVLQRQVQTSKFLYLKRFDQDFLFHFNYLCAKYQIDEKMQVEGLFTDSEFKEWMSNIYQKSLQIKL